MLLVQPVVIQLHLLQLKIIKNKIFKLLNGRMRTSIPSMRCNRSPPRIKHFRQMQNSPKFLLHNLKLFSVGKKILHEVNFLRSRSDF